MLFTINGKLELGAICTNGSKLGQCLCVISDESFALVPFLLVGSVMLIAIVMSVVPITLLFRVCAPSHLSSALCPFHWWSMSVPLTLVVLEQIRRYHIQDLTVLYCLSAQWWAVCLPPCFSLGPLLLAVSRVSYTYRFNGKHWQRRRGVLSNVNTRTKILLSLCLLLLYCLMTDDHM